MKSKLFRTPWSIRIGSWVTVSVWVVIALFPILWLIVMSLKLPTDAFNANPWNVITGPNTREMVGGISVLTVALASILSYIVLTLFAKRDTWMSRLAHRPGEGNNPWILTLLYILFIGTATAIFLFVLPFLAGLFKSILGNVPLIGNLTEPVFGVTTQHYRNVWIENGFYKHFINTMVVTLGVVSISLTIGTLAAYGLARTRNQWVFWVLIIALIFRALPQSTLVTGYLPPFIEWGLYGKRIAVVIVLVAINQPFTIWMLRSFFMNIPAALDEAALVDGCNRIEAFRHVIMPIMWPGVITTGLFSFLLAYNDYLVSALLLDGETRTMVPAILAYFNRETTLTDQLEAIAAASSIILPLFILILFFQKQIVSGLTQGAVKG